MKQPGPSSALRGHSAPQDLHHGPDWASHPHGPCEHPDLLPSPEPPYALPEPGELLRNPALEVGSCAKGAALHMGRVVPHHGFPPQAALRAETASAVGGSSLASQHGRARTREQAAADAELLRTSLPFALRTRRFAKAAQGVAQKDPSSAPSSASSSEPSAEAAREQGGSAAGVSGRGSVVVPGSLFEGLGPAAQPPPGPPAPAEPPTPQALDAPPTSKRRPRKKAVEREAEAAAEQAEPLPGPSGPMPSGSAPAPETEPSPRRRTRKTPAPQRSPATDAVLEAEAVSAAEEAAGLLPGGSAEPPPARAPAAQPAKLATPAPAPPPEAAVVPVGAWPALAAPFSAEPHRSALWAKVVGSRMLGKLEAAAEAVRTE